MSAHDDLHAQIAQRLFGWERVNDPTTWARWRNHEGGEFWHPLDYTTDPAATALVWQWLEGQVPGPLKHVHLTYGPSGGVVLCDLHVGARFISNHGATWPEALCRAALALAEAR